MSLRVYFEEEKIIGKIAVAPAHSSLTLGPSHRSLAPTHSISFLVAPENGIAVGLSSYFWCDMSGRKGIVTHMFPPHASSKLSASLPTVQESLSRDSLPTRQTLSPEEIERICKAFLRLLQAPLTTEQGVKHDAK